MTTAGRIAVYVILTLSLLFFGWSLAVYTQRVDWADRTTAAAKSPGKLTELQNQIKTLTAARDLAEARWQAARADLALRDQQRPAYERWYAEQLAMLQTGADATGKQVAQPVQTLPYDKSGRLALAYQNGQAVVVGPRDPIKNRGQDLRSIDGYTQDYARTQNQIKDEQEQTAKLIEKEGELTALINGEEPKKPGETGKKGLRGVLADERAAEQKSVDEQEYLEPLRYNREAERDLLLDRQAGLKARLEELKRVGVAAGRP
jgi:hypothetical protein